MSAARTERLLNLLTLLLNTRRPVSLRELRELPEFDAYLGGDPKSGERAFERDKAALIELGIPLRWVAPEQEEDEETGGGYLIDRERYYLPELDLTPADWAVLSIAGAAAVALDSFPGRAAVIRALAKLGFDVDEDEQRTPALVHTPLAAGIDATQVGAGLDVLHQAVAHAQRVKMTYVALSSAASRREVDPYGLYYRQAAWYLVGYCHLRKAERTFHLGRIKHVEAIGRTKAYTIPETFDLSSHTDLQPWEYPQEKPMSVVIRLADKLVPAVGELFGARARIEKTGAETRLHLTVRHPAALIAAVLPFGAAAEVLSPLPLRKTVARIYTKLAAQYA